MFCRFACANSEQQNSKDRPKSVCAVNVAPNRLIPGTLDIGDRTDTTLVSSSTQAIGIKVSRQKDGVWIVEEAGQEGDSLPKL